MTRLLGLSLLGVVSLGCGRLDIGDYRRPYACVANRDGGLDGGRQCLQGWSCGFDDRCFDQVLDGGQRPAEWRCAEDSQCPSAWRCGQLVGQQRFCQELDAGAPSPCVDDEGCRGGWRCSGGQRCFNPKDTSDAGARGCSSDLQCPDDFRCAEFVSEKPQLCILRDAGSEAWCASDRGCEGGWRCDFAAQRCVRVTDVLTPGLTSGLTVRTINPRHDGERPPLHFAITSYSMIQPGLFGAINTASVPGVVMAVVLTDGGLRLTAQPRDEPNPRDGGSLAVYELELPQVVNQPVVELAVGPQGPLLRYDDGRAAFYDLATRSWSSWTNCSVVRQADALIESGTSELASICDGTVRNGARTFPDAGGVVELLPLRDRNVFFMNDHRLLLDHGATTFSLRRADGGALLPGTPLSIAAAFTLPTGGSDLSLGIVSTVRTDAGLTQLVANLVGLDADPQLEFNSGQLFDACPGGAALLQVTMIEDAQRRPAVRARCAVADGGSYPVDVELFDQQYVARPAIEDPVPWQDGLVPLRTSPFVRGHAGANGRAWHTQLTDGGLAVGAQALRAVTLDRQPASLITYRDARFAERRVFALSSGRVFSDDTRGGLFSQLKDPEGTPLSTVQGREGLIVASEGLISTSDGQPRVVATLPPGLRFVAPASGVLTSRRVEGDDQNIVLVASSDSLFVADVTQSIGDAFAQPAVFSRVLVPVPGVDLLAMTLGPTDAGVLGYLTTNSQNLRFTSEDLVRWSLTPVATPTMDNNALPLAVWAEPDGGAARTTFNDGRVWSLPIMVPLSQRLVSPDGGAPLTAVDTARLCGDVFLASSEGVFRLAPSGTDAGLPGWAPVPSINGQLDSLRGLRLYATRDSIGRLFVVTRSGKVLEVTASTPCP